MPKQKVVFIDPKFNEYLYDKLSRLTDDQKLKLSSAELKRISTAKDLRTFITWGSLERKFAICTKVGIPWSINFYENPQTFKELLMTVYKQQSIKGMRSETIDKMIKGGVFIVTGKEYAISISMLAQNCHSDVYFLNPDFMKISSAAAYANSSIKANAMNPEYLRSEKSLQTMARMYFESQMSEIYIRSNGLEMVDVVILMFLFSMPNNYMRSEMVARNVEGQYTARTVNIHLYHLFNNGYVDKMPSENNKPAYTISAKGVIFIGNVLRSVLYKTMNDT